MTGSRSTGKSFSFLFFSILSFIISYIIPAFKKRFVWYSTLYPYKNWRKMVYTFYRSKCCSSTDVTIVCIFVCIRRSTSYFAHLIFLNIRGAGWLLGNNPSTVSAVPSSMHSTRRHWIRNKSRRKKLHYDFIASSITLSWVYIYIYNNTDIDRVRVFFRLTQLGCRGHFHQVKHISYCSIDSLLI